MAPAWAADVISSNVVGYNKITLHPGMNMIGGLFQGVGTGEALSLNGQFTDAVGKVTAGEADDEADTILVFHADNQEYDSPYFFFYFEGEDEDYNNKWYNTGDASGDPTTDSLSGGTGGWYRHRGSSAITLTMAGEVPTNRTYQVALSRGMNFVANPYPCAIPFNGNTFTVDGVQGGEADDEADVILFFNGLTQEYSAPYFFFYYEGEEEEYNNKWYNTSDASGDPTTDTIAPGQGFWYRHRGTGATLTFTKPY